MLVGQLRYTSDRNQRSIRRFIFYTFLMLEYIELVLTACFARAICGRVREGHPSEQGGCRLFLKGKRLGSGQVLAGWQASY